MALPLHYVNHLDWTGATVPRWAFPAEPCLLFLPLFSLNSLTSHFPVLGAAHPQVPSTRALSCLLGHYPSALPGWSNDISKVNPPGSSLPPAAGHVHTLCNFNSIHHDPKFLHLCLCLLVFRGDPSFHSCMPSTQDSAWYREGAPHICPQQYIPGWMPEQKAPLSEHPSLSVPLLAFYLPGILWLL